MLLSHGRIRSFSERAFHEDYYLAERYQLTTLSTEQSKVTLHTAVASNLSLLYLGIPYSQSARNEDAASVQKGLEFVDRYLLATSESNTSKKSLKRFASIDYLAIGSEKLERARQNFINLYKQICRGYDGPSDQEPTITNEYIRYFLMACAVCPPEWIALRPDQLTEEDWNTGIYKPEYVNNTLRQALGLHDTEVLFLNCARNRMIRVLEATNLQQAEIQEKKDQSDSNCRADASPDIALDLPLAGTFKQIWNELQTNSKLKQLAKDRLRNLKRNAKRYKQALNNVIEKNPNSQIVTPTFRIQSNQINDSDRRKLLSAAWGEFTAFIVNPNRKMLEQKIQSTLLKDHLIWWATKQHTALLPAAGQRWQPHSYLVTMLLFQEKTFERFPTPTSPPKKSWSLTMLALKGELVRLWNFSVLRAANTIPEIKGAPIGHVEFHTKIPVLPPGVDIVNRMLDITCLSPQSKDSQIPHLHAFLDYHIYRDRALFLTLLHKSGSGKKPQTLRKMGNARALQPGETPWFKPYEHIPPSLPYVQSDGTN